MKKQNPRRSFGGAIAIGLCLTLGTPSISLGFGPGGHMMIAQIAFDRLNPRAKAQVKALLAIPIDPAAVSTKSKDFVSASHWADDLRSIPAFKPLEPLHFIDKPFSTDGTRLPAIPTPNIVTALRENVRILKTSTDQKARAQALRLVIHFVGDIHQPLHCSARVDRAHTDGDQGGNLMTIKIPGRNGELHNTNLHSYWDSGIGSFPKGGPPPEYRPPPLSQIPPAAALARQANPPTDPALRLNDPFNYPAWANESFTLARTVVYSGVSNGMEPSAAYKSRAVKVIRKRVAWGGYRLAALLNSIWP
ncbi:MAG TPA: S1/P1 nuclease [Chthoniobacterales bacterium]|nr:S1/P1 nuclease [Chthoniobacterales bacterium]